MQSGYGHVKIVDNGGGNNALELKPKAQSGQTATSSTEVIGPEHGSEFTFSGTISTPEQLRQGATPNAWETGWLVWNYTDEAQRITASSLTSRPSAKQRARPPCCNN